MTDPHVSYPVKQSPSRLVAIFIILLLPLSLIIGGLWSIGSLASPPAPPSSPTLTPNALTPSPSPKGQGERGGYGNLPLHFEANVQPQNLAAQPVRFLARGNGYHLFLTGDEAVLALRRGGEKGEGGAQAVLRLRLLDANPQTRISMRDELPGKSHYFIGKDPQGWRTNVAHYARVEYADIYPGVSLVYYGNQRELEYDFVVQPGASPSVIALGVQGAERVEIDAQGDLLLHVAGGVVRQRKPVVYQEIDGARHSVDGEYTLVDASSGSARVAFRVGAYDARHPLVIDPVLVYSTFLGGTGVDEAYGIAVDPLGQAVVVGRTDSADFPTTTAPYQGVCNCAPSVSHDVFIAKLNSTGSALLFSTYFGGSGDDQGFAVALDGSANIYLTGRTNSTNLPTSAGAFGQSSFGGLDAFAAKFNATGSVLLYSTYVGGGSSDEAFDIAVDGANDAYIVGSTNSTDFPTTTHAYQPNLAGVRDAFVTKLNIGGTSLLYSTYLGGTGSGFDERANGVAVDAFNKVYVVGQTPSSDFPTKNALQPIYGSGTQHAFLAKLDPSQIISDSTLVYSTFIRGTGEDVGTAVALDPTGGVYITGRTNSTDFLTTTNAYQTNRQGPQDAFVVRLDAGGLLSYSTYLGGGGSEEGLAIAVDSAGSAYVAGKTDSDTSTTPFPTVSAFQEVKGGTPGGGILDGFVAKLSPTGDSLWLGSYLGSSNPDQINAIAIHSSGLYIAGRTNSMNFPMASNPFQIFPRGSTEAFVARIADLGAPQSAGFALHFDGNDDYLFIPVANNTLDVAGAPHTLEAWVRWTDGTGHARGIISLGAFSNSVSLSTGSGTGGQDKVSYGLNNIWYYNAGLGLNNGQWRHIAAVSSTTGITIYVDGVPQAPFGFGSIAVGPFNKIGVAPNYGFFSGQIDEVRVWNIARSQGDILYAMNRRLTGAESGLVGYWKFDDGADPTTDYSGHGNDGTFANGPVWISSTAPLIDASTLVTPLKHIKGRVTNVGASTIASARIVASRTDGNGQVTLPISGVSPITYFMHLGPGIWSLTVVPDPASAQPPNWVYLNPPTYIAFANNMLEVTQTVNFTLTAATATLQGQLLLPNGSVGTFPPNSLHVSAHTANGVGNAAFADINGNFSLNLPAGSYLVSVVSADPTFFLLPFAVNLSSGQTLNLGGIKLRLRTADISGLVLDATNSNPISGVEVVALQRDGSGFVRSTSVVTGGYGLKVYSGTWDVLPVVPASLNYALSDPPQRVVITGSVAISLPPFELLPTGAALDGRVVLINTTQILTEVQGFVTARTSNLPTLGAPVISGTFLLKLAPSLPYTVELTLPPGADYIPPSAITVTLGPSETRVLTVPVKSADALITGSLRLLGSSVVVTGVDGLVVATSPSGSHRVTRIDASNGRYALYVSAGRWVMTAVLDPRAGYLLRDRAQNALTIGANQILTFDFDVQALDGLITGTVFVTSTPAAGAFVHVEELVNPTTGPRLHTGGTTDSNGTFSIRVPNGAYLVGASIVGEGLIEPLPRAVQVGPGGTATTTLVFRAPDAVIVGTVMLPTSPITHEAFVWAVSRSGGAASARTDASGAFSLSVAAGQIWHIGAHYEQGGYYHHSGVTAVNIPVPTVVTQNLVLTHKEALPDPVSVTFDATQYQVINLSDGTEIQIPAGALADRGMVTVRVTPRSDTRRGAGRLAVGLAYELNAYDADGQPITRFNDYVSIILHYTDQQLAVLGISENDLVPSYYDEVSGTWLPVENVIVDSVNNTVTLLVDHFTSFEDMGITPNRTYLPLIMR